ncbi:MAG: TraX family protein [Coriobacteriia bacterium]|nr:TraX family protein [Coriobacteriia bacterium]
MQEELRNTVAHAPSLAESKREAQVLTIIKWAAMILMIVDHTALMLFYDAEIGRIIGRLAFPLFAYAVAIGLQYTRSEWKYLSRIFLFALISEIPFNIATRHSVFSLLGQNVLFTFSIAILMYIFVKKFKGAWWSWLLAFIVGYVLAELLRVDYGGIGVMTVLVFKLVIFGAKSDKLRAHLGQAAGVAVISLGYVLKLMIVYQTTRISLQIYAAFALLILVFSNAYPAKFSLRSKKLSKLFYLVYPLQFIVLSLLAYKLGFSPLPDMISLAPDHSSSVILSFIRSLL